MSRYLPDHSWRDGGLSVLSDTDGLTPKLLPKFVSVASAVACPRTASGKISPTISHEMGPKLTCSLIQQGVAKAHLLHTACTQDGSCHGQGLRSMRS